MYGAYDRDRFFNCRYTWTCISPPNLKPDFSRYANKSLVCRVAEAQNLVWLPMGTCIRQLHSSMTSGFRTLRWQDWVKSLGVFQNNFCDCCIWLYDFHNISISFWAFSLNINTMMIIMYGFIISCFMIGYLGFQTSIPMAFLVFLGVSWIANHMGPKNVDDSI